MARHSNLSNAEIQALAHAHYGALTPMASSFRPQTGEPELEREAQAYFASQHISDLNRQIAAAQFEKPIRLEIETLLSARGLSLDEFDDDTQTRLAHGIARATIEYLRLFQFRLAEPLLPFETSDPLLATPPESAIALRVDTNPKTPEADMNLGPTVGSLVSAYLAAKAKSWVQKTLASRTRKLALFVEHVGAETRISAISAETMRGFVEGLSRMRRSHHTGCDRSFAGRQTEDVGARIDLKTVALHVDDVRALFLWAERLGYCERAPLAGLVVDLPKKPKGIKSRAPFDAAAAEKLFSSPVFLGCKSPRDRFRPGTILMKDAKFWLPILGYYTGARLSELAQLHLDDVREEGEVLWLDINEENAPGFPQARKHLKSKAAVRKVPVHSDVLALGFREFVEARRNDKRARATNRLFFEVPYGADGQPSTVFSKWFGRLMDNAALTDRRLVFHSFRHTVEDALRNAQLPQYVINRLIGHEEGHVSEQYGDGISLVIAQAAIEAMKVPLRLPELFKRAESECNQLH